MTKGVFIFSSQSKQPSPRPVLLKLTLLHLTTYGMNLQMPPMLSWFLSKLRLLGVWLLRARSKKQTRDSSVSSQSDRLSSSSSAFFSQSLTTLRGSGLGRTASEERQALDLFLGDIMELSMRLLDFTRCRVVFTIECESGLFSFLRGSGERMELLSLFCGFTSLAEPSREPASAMGDRTFSRQSELRCLGICWDSMNSFCEGSWWEKRVREKSSREVREVSSWELEWAWLSCSEFARWARRGAWLVVLSSLRVFLAVSLTLSTLCCMSLRRSSPCLQAKFSQSLQWLLNFSLWKCPLRLASSSLPSALHRSNPRLYCISRLQASACSRKALVAAAYCSLICCSISSLMLATMRTKLAYSWCSSASCWSSLSAICSSKLRHCSSRYSFRCNVCQPARCSPSCASLRRSSSRKSDSCWKVWSLCEPNSAQWAQILTFQILHRMSRFLLWMGHTRGPLGDCHSPARLWLLSSRSSSTCCPLLDYCRYSPVLNWLTVVPLCCLLACGGVLSLTESVVPSLPSISTTLLLFSLPDSPSLSLSALPLSLSALPLSTLPRSVGCRRASAGFWLYLFIAKWKWIILRPAKGSRSLGIRRGS